MSLYSRSSRTQPDATAFLQTIPLFSSVSAPDRAEVAQRVSRHTYPQGAFLFHQDTPGSTLYMIEEGSVRVFGVGLTGQEHTLNTFGPGEIFGELSLIDGRPRSASAITMSASVVWILTQVDLNYLLERCSSLSKALLRLLAERVRTAASHAEAIIFQDVPGRLAYELLNLAERHGRKTPVGTQIDIPLTQTDLATIVGATRESVNKAMTFLRTRNFIQVDGVQITIADLEGLRRVLIERGR